MKPFHVLNMFLNFWHLKPYVPIWSVLIKKHVLKLLLLKSSLLRSGVAPGIFQWGDDSSDEGAKIWFSGYYKYQKSRKKLRFTFQRGLACSDGGL